MPGPVSRDSIAKCSPGNDLYAMIQNPALKVPSKPTSMKKVDSIKSLQKDMERDAVAKIGKWTENFIVVARAGKFVFLAIAIPPYILLYGLPKWLLAEALPSLLHGGMKPFKIMTEKIKGLFKANDNGILSHLKNTMAAISTQVAEYIKWIDRTSRALFVHLKHQIVSMGYRLLQPFMPTFQKSLKAAESVTKLLLQKTYEKGDQHAEIARQFVTFAWNVAKHELVSQFRPYALAVKSGFNSLRKNIEKLIEKPRIEIQKFKTAATHRLKKTQEVLKSVGLKISKNTATIAVAITSYVVKPIVEWSAPKIQWFAQNLQAGREKMAHHFEKIRGFVQNVLSGVMDAANMSRHVVINTVKNVFEAITPALKHFFNPERGFKKKAEEMLKNLGGKFKRLKSSIVPYAIDRLKATQHQLLAFVIKFREFLRYLMQQVKQLPRRLFALAQKSYHFAVYSLVKLVNFFSWILILSQVLGRLAWEELRERSSLIIKSVRINKSS